MEMVGFDQRKKRELRRDLKRKRGQVWNARIWEPAMHAGGAGKPGVREKADGDVELCIDGGDGQRDVSCDGDDAVREHFERGGVDGDPASDGDDRGDDADVECGGHGDLDGESERQWSVHLSVDVE